MERPRTPPQQWLASPLQTPQGSPSKKQVPPGANTLSDIFEKALKFTPIAALSPTKTGRPTQAPALSSKGNNIPVADETVNGKVDSLPHKDPSSPGKKANKENAPPGPKHGKDVTYQQSSAAASRQELYQPREQGPGSPKKVYDTQRALSVEELEKLQKPQVKRLANVTQLCTLLRCQTIC